MQTEQQRQEPVWTEKSTTSVPESATDFPEWMQSSSPEVDTPSDKSIEQTDRKSDASNPEVESKSVELGLKEKLADAEARAAEMHDAYLRAKAEVENFRRRAQEDVTRAHKFAIEGFAESLVPVKDSLETALKIETPTLGSIKEGVEMTLKQLNAAFEKNKLTEISPMPGDKLDPMKHQAISMVPVEQNPNTIISVLQKGYMIADRLLRPALVTVAQQKASKSEA